jgi:ABC-type lipopolysaccharide export system ATPase subunit
MNEGRVLVDGTADDARTSRAVQEIYIGTGTAGLASRARGHDGRDTGPALLTVERVDTYYGKSHILREASLIAHEREIVALLGRNGAGKSTMLKTIIGIARASGGRIALGGADLRDLPAAAVARLGIGYVPQGRCSPE